MFPSAKQQITSPSASSTSSSSQVILAQHGPNQLVGDKQLPRISQRWQPLAKVQVHLSSHLALCCCFFNNKFLRIWTVTSHDSCHFHTFLGFLEKVGWIYPSFASKFHCHQAMIPDLPFLFVRYLAEKKHTLSNSLCIILCTLYTSFIIFLEVARLGMCCRWQCEAWIQKKRVEHMVFDGWQQWSHA